MKRVGLVLTAFFGLAATAVPASADITWTLNQGSLGPAGTVYGTVVATQKGSGTSAYVEVTIALAKSGSLQNLFLATGTHSGIAWDMSTVPGAITVISSVTPPSNPAKFNVQPLNGSYDDPGFANSSNGEMEYAIKPTATKGSEASENSIVFDITNPGIGITLSKGLFTSNVGGYAWAVDIGWDCSINASNGKADCGSNTGVVAALPEPSTWTMSITALAGLTGLTMLRRRRKPAHA